MQRHLLGPKCHSSATVQKFVICVWGAGCWNINNIKHECEYLYSHWGKFWQIKKIWNKAPLIPIIRHANLVMMDRPASQPAKARDLWAWPGVVGDSPLVYWQNLLAGSIGSQAGILCPKICYLIDLYFGLWRIFCQRTLLWNKVKFTFNSLSVQRHIHFWIMVYYWWTMTLLHNKHTEHRKLVLSATCCDMTLNNYLTEVRLQ